DDASEERSPAADGEHLPRRLDRALRADAARVAERDQDGLVAAEALDLGEERRAVAAVDAHQLAEADAGDDGADDQADDLAHPPGDLDRARAVQPVAQRGAGRGHGAPPSARRTAASCASRRASNRPRSVSTTQPPRATPRSATTGTPSGATSG